jgi:hypothetical protein
MAENRGGFRPTAPQNNPANISANGGNGQSGKQPARYISGLPYGQGQETLRTQQAADMSQPTNSPTSLGTTNPLPEITPLTAGTEMPNQSVLDGAPIGAGAMNIPGLPKNVSGDPDIDMIRAQYPIMQAWASMPGTSIATAQYVKYLGTII